MSYEELPGYVENPLLDISELGQAARVPDLREEVPYLIPYLSPGEIVVKVEPVDKNLHPSIPSGLDSLYRLTEKLTEPANAAVSFPENDDLAELSSFRNLFGRDSLTTAWLLRDIYPSLTQTTLINLAELQGTVFGREGDEEPGEILHDNMNPDSPVARKFEHYLHWKYPLYGSIDATPLFITATIDAAELDEDFLKSSYLDKDSQQRNMAEALEASVNWLTRRLDQNQEGFLEFHKPEYKGLDNQAWMDSYHAYIHEDGSFANHGRGIAALEVQGYAYDALLKATKYFSQLDGHDARAKELEERAQKLQSNFIKEFWIEDTDGGFFAVATDRHDSDKPHKLAVRSANMGLLLNSMILDGDDREMVNKRQQVIRSLFSPQMLAAAGVRTMSSTEAAFNPYSYHNGGVWPHVNGLIAAGLERHGYYGLSWELYRRLFRNVATTHSFPELLQGGNELEPRLSDKNVYVYSAPLDMVYLIERVPQEIQAWSVAAILAAKYKMPLALGLHRRLPAMPAEALDLSKRKFEQQTLRSIPS